MYVGVFEQRRSVTLGVAAHEDNSCETCASIAGRHSWGCKVPTLYSSGACSIFVPWILERRNEWKKPKQETHSLDPKLTSSSVGLGCQGKVFTKLPTSIGIASALSTTIDGLDFGEFSSARCEGFRGVVVQGLTHFGMGGRGRGGERAGVRVEGRRNGKSIYLGQHRGKIFCVSGKGGL